MKLSYDLTLIMERGQNADNQYCHISHKGYTYPFTENQIILTAVIFKLPL
jgi:hypothetical protein